jgi:hypothetical protein
MDLFLARPVYHAEVVFFEGGQVLGICAAFRIVISEFIPARRMKLVK